MLFFAGLIAVIIYSISPRTLPSITSLPPGTIEIINLTEEKPLHVYLEYSNPGTLDKPETPWRKRTGSGKITNPIAFEPGTDNPPNDVGAAVWQIVTLNYGDTISLYIPDFTENQPWSVRPLKYINNKPCTGGAGDCGMPVIIESGKDMVGDMSAVDGVNFFLKYEMTTKGGISTIDFNTNPCTAIGANPKGCRNPSVDGIFKHSIPCLPSAPHCWESPPCPAGTCNTAEFTKVWCDAIHSGQCANSSSTWENSTGAASCVDRNMFTTYCYSHDDANSSPYFSHPYNMRLTYKDL